LKLENGVCFLEIKKSYRSDKVESYRLISKEDIAAKYPDGEIVAWASNARLNSRFSLTTKFEKHMYIRLDEFDEKDLEKWAH
jgi:hypothetical protein